MKYCQALIKGRPLRYSVRRNKRARHRKVTISRKKGVVVTLRPKDSLAGIDDFFKKWENWLEEKVENDGVWDGPVVRQLASGSTVFLAGVPCTLEISPLKAGRKRNRVYVEGTLVRMELFPEDVLFPLPVLVKYLKKEARSIFKAKVEYWSQVTGLFPTRVIVGERTTRWGSCSSRGTLSFCYRLVMAPPSVLDAIVIHELCHLRHLNHGQEFWALVRSFYPDYDEVRVWLRENENELLL